MGCQDGNDTDAAADLYIDSSNQEQVLAVLFDSIDNATPQLPLDQNASSSDTSQSPLLYAAPSTQEPQSAADDVPQSCRDGGMVYVSEENGKSVISYENCQEGGITTNGKVTLSYSEGAQEVTYTLTDYTFKSADKEYKTSLTTYTLSSGHIAYTSTGKMAKDNETTEFSRYSYSLDIIDNRLNISVNGALKTASLGDWMVVKTNRSMQMSGKCPTVGELEVQGKNARLKVQFKNDQSLDLYLNNTVAGHYDDCNNIPDSIDMPL